MKKFKCKECGYIHIGDEPPQVCPVCGFEHDVFYEMESEESSSVDFTDSIVTDNDLLKQVMNLFDMAKEQAIVANSMYLQALKEDKKSEAEHFESLTKKLVRDASILAMVSGEFLEFSTDANRKQMDKLMDKYNSKFESLIESLVDSSEDEIAELLKGSK